MSVSEWNKVVFTDESRNFLQHHDGRFRVWRHRGERMLNSCVTHRKTGSAPGVMVWGAERYFDTIQRNDVLSFVARHTGSSFRDNVRLHTTRISSDCHRNFGCESTGIH
ncbi:transposable element Tc1 transposase [Trichonephila clavipes]|nr:transposable element Tc1 transposase [Trichonephila clavipes]